MSTKTERIKVGAEASEKGAPSVHITVRVPAHVHAQLEREAQRKSEDLSTTIRRHIFQGLARDEIQARFDKIERKLDDLSELHPVVLQLAQNINQLGAQQGTVLAEIKKVAEAYSEIFDALVGNEGEK